ncbi:MAG TPA: potassium-transporting ATPase subunit KdpC [Caulobacteraceae bacterium]|nr:potassium-transporting ATPase subunit KdpC [Caulobacteraceae bacterium]
MISALRPAVVSTIVFTLLLGVAYPLALTGVAQATLPFQAQGSLLKDKTGRVVGSALIAQPFTAPQYLHPRPSAAGKGYDTTSSGGSNLGPLNADLAKREQSDADSIRKQDGAGSGPLPADAVTTSASGLDPDISPENAKAQVARIARARGVDARKVAALIERATEGRAMGFLGQPRINVLKVNMALDARYPMGHPGAQ